MNKVRSSIITTMLTSMVICSTSNDLVIMLSTHDGQYINEEIIELSLIFNRFLKKWITGMRKMPFVLNGEPHSLKTLALLEQDLLFMSDCSAEYTELLAYTKQKFVRKTERFIDCSRSFAKALYPLIEEDCIKRDRSNSFLRTWIQTDQKKSNQLFMDQINSFSDLYALCTDLVHLIKDIVFSCPKTLHTFELRIKKIKKFKELLPTVLEELNLQEEEIDKKLLLAEFKFHEVSTFSLDEINKEQVRVVIQTFLQRQNDPATA